MKKLVIVLMIAGLVSTAAAGTIIDIQTGAYTVGDFVEVSGAVVTGVLSNGFYMNEIPNAPYSGIWVYTGTGNHTALVGDEVDVGGYYEEYITSGGSSLTEINAHPTGVGAYVTVIGEHMESLYPMQLTIAQFNADPEPYECCFVTITDGMVVTEVPNTYGEWDVESYETPGQFLAVDNYWYDSSGVFLGQCFNCGTGIMHEDYGEYKIRFFENAVCEIDCAIPNENMTFSDVKALYR
ncbi:hypothetical protein KKG45_06575 [bacterium]|nr:hypothetical protein [bacterium]MBU1072892.1 hypothetical protein [bacterium]MBU1675910.1 hypothetical protein [bacterium]